MPAQKKVFKISVPEPCSENWNAMKPHGNGRLCENCKKVVVDFSQLSDKELYSYFSSGQPIPCGRFHNSQLNIDLVKAKAKKYSWKRFYKTVAALFALLSMKNTEAITTKKIDTQLSPLPVRRPIINTEKITISGTVKDHRGNPLENAEIMIDSIVLGRSDKDGRFQFELEITDPEKSYTLFVSYPELVTVVRNYHPAMQSTSYDIILRKEAQAADYFHTIGIPLPSIVLPEMDIRFTKSVKALTQDAKIKLGDMALIMRQNPETFLKLTAYAGSAKEITLAKARQKVIIDFLVEWEGISSDRFLLKIQPKASGR